MAYASNYLSDEEKKKQQEGAGVNTSGVIGGYTSPGGDAAGAAQQPAKTPGTGYLNLAQYLDTNKGKGADLANAATADVQKDVTNYGNNAQQTLDTSKQKFESAAGTGQAEGVKSAIANDPYSNKEQAKAFLGAGYTGPSATDYTAQLAQQKDKLTGQLGKLDDFETQQQALQNAYGKTGNYGTGYGLLDSFLLRGDQSGQQKLNEVKAKAGDVARTYDQTAQELAAREQKAKADLEANKKQVLDTALGKKQNIEQTGQQKIQELDKLHQAYKANEGYQSGSLGDVLQDKDRMDLEALAEIARLDPNSDWYKKTFDVGKAKAGQAPLPVETVAATPAATAEQINKGILGKDLGGAVTQAPMGDYTDPGDTIKDAARVGGVIKPIIDTFNIPSNTGRAISDLAKTPSMDNLQGVYDASAKKAYDIGQTATRDIARETLSAAEKLNDEAKRGAASVERYANEGSDKVPGIVNTVLQPIAKTAVPVLNTAADVGGKIINEAQKLPNLSIPKLKNPFGGGGGGGSELRDKNGNVISGSGAEEKYLGIRKNPKQRM